MLAWGILGHWIFWDFGYFWGGTLLNSHAWLSSYVTSSVCFFQKEEVELVTTSIIMFFAHQKTLLARVPEIGCIPSIIQGMASEQEGIGISCIQITHLFASDPVSCLLITNQQDQKTFRPIFEVLYFASSQWKPAFYEVNRDGNGLPYTVPCRFSDGSSKTVYGKCRELL